MLVVLKNSKQAKSKVVEAAIRLKQVVRERAFATLLCFLLSFLIAYNQIFPICQQ